MTDDEPEQTPDDPKSHVANKRPDRFGFVFRKGVRRGSSRPLKMDKLIEGRWVLLALLRVPVTAEDERYPKRLADAFGGLVRLRAGEHVIEEWDDGRPAEQMRCA